jgi:hypothetical protein
MIKPPVPVDLYDETKRQSKKREITLLRRRLVGARSIMARRGERIVLVAAEKQ